MTKPHNWNVLRRTSAAATLAVFASPGLALTPDELWTQLEDYLTSAGYEVSADEQSSGDTLTLSNIVLKMEMDEDETSFTVTIPEYILTGQGDGTVLFDMAPSQTIDVRVEAPDEDPVDLELLQTTENFSLVASGTPEDIDYTFAADSAGVSLANLQRGGEPVDLGTIELTLNGLTGTATIAQDDGYTVEQRLDAEGLSYNVDIANPEPDSSGTIKMSGSLEGISSTGGGHVPEGVDISDMAAAMEAGYSATATLNYSGGQTDLAYSDAESSFDYRSSSDGGSFVFTIDAARLVYQILASGVSMSASGSEMPFPVDVSANELGLQLAMPLSETEEAQDFGLSLTVNELALPDQIWAMADPQNGLPHDPLTVELALSGTGRLFVDVTDEAEMEQLGETGGTPGEIETLKLDKLTVRGLGAEIGATADLDVDNEATSPFGQGPNVFGTANIRMTGVVGLLNTLSQMGLVPPAQAMMGAGMLSQLGKPVNGPDDLEADIELSEQGELSVNGMPMPLR
jgi:hypothetical protein